ncbi:N-acetyltransferase [Flagellimonas beolgyonensis]|uniref:N-acetyltransferase n=1 Tax=Flagellimonas beolgyonensis TaxID=864064 RepID=UPI000F8C8565
MRQKLLRVPYQWTIGFVAIHHGWDQHIELLALEIDKYLNRTEVGNALMERVMEYAERADFKVIDTSLEVQSFLKKRPEYQKLVATAAIPLPQKTPQPNL